MTETIMLTPDDVQDFVNVAALCDFDVDIYNSARYSVDAKSFLGVFGLDFSRPIYVTCNGYNEKLESYLNKHRVAC